MLLKIGELAKRTGLTVRTLHHYDAIGLLCPSGRSPSGYRLYDRSDIERLHRIQALRRLDIPLADIGVLLDGGTADLQTVIDQQIAALEQQVQRAVTLRGRLAVLRTRIHSNDDADLVDWLDTLAMMAVYDKYFTPEELDRLHREGLPDTAELNDVVAKVRGLMERGTPHDNPEALSLAKPWLILSLQYMAGDARLIHKLSTIHRTEANVHLLTGVDPVMLDYMTRVTAEFRLGLYARHLDAAVVEEVRERFHQHYLSWPPLFAEARELYESGTSPDSPAVLDLAARWIALFRAVWGNDPHVRLKVLEANALEPDLMAGSGMEEPIFEIVRQGIVRVLDQQQKEMR
jgi:DNA-binding transcriptional MerR regulator